MIYTYFKTSFRILWRSRFTTFINIAGLSVGIASCLLIYIYVQNELSYDQHHSKKNRVYRVVSDMTLGGESDKLSLSSYMLSPTLRKDYPQVEEAVRVMSVRKQTMWIEEKPFQFEDNFMVDSGFFALFDYQFIDGDPQTALKEPQSVVITDEVAEKMFGKTEGLLGKTIQYTRQPYKITGVVKDVKNNSHLYFNTLLSLNSLSPGMVDALEHDWFYMAQTNYVLFKRESDAIGFEARLAELRDKYIVPWLQTVNSDGKITFHLQALPDIHLSKNYAAGYTKTGNRSYIYIFSVVAIFILLIACINYVNLATATASKRAKEIGIRKTAGAHSSALFRQFIIESLITAFVAIIFALILVHALLPFFNTLIDKTLSVPYSFSLFGLFLLLLLFLGTVAGAYPAFYLSSLQPVAVLKSQKAPGGFSVFLRKSLVVLQFFISVSFIVSTIVVYSQMYFMKHADLGFNKDQVLVVSVPVADSSFVHKFEVVKQELTANPDIRKISATNSIPGLPTGTLIHTIETPGKPRMEKAIDFMTVSHDFINIMDIKLVSGRDFSRDFKSDDSAAFIVNETALKMYGWKDPYASTLENGLGYKGKVIGVVKDFHFTSLQKPIQPLVMVLEARLQGFLLLKINGNHVGQTVSFVEKTWGKYSHRYPMEYFFLDERFDKLYRDEEKMMTIFAYFSIVSIIISCLGLFALITFSIEQRTKEIGIRKVLGARIFDIVFAIGKDFAKLVAIAALAAFPIAWYFMNEWLKDFASRISVSWWMFAVAFGIIALVSGITLLGKILKASVANPILSLRYE